MELCGVEVGDLVLGRVLGVSLVKHMAGRGRGAGVDAGRGPVRLFRILGRLLALILGM